MTSDTRDFAGQIAIVTDAQRAAFLPLTPIGRFAQSPEVAAAIVFLCSEASSFIAGADLSVDGGMVAL